MNRWEKKEKEPGPFDKMTDEEREMFFHEAREIVTAILVILAAIFAIKVVW